MSTGFKGDSGSRTTSPAQSKQDLGSPTGVSITINTVLGTQHAIAGLVAASCVFGNLAGRTITVLFGAVDVIYIPSRGEYI